MQEHPNHVLAISTVRMASTSEVDDCGGPIVCLATFSVERIGETEARFAATHVTFEPHGDWRAPGAHVRCLLHRYTFAIGCRPSSDSRREKYRRLRSPAYEELPGTAELPSLQRRVIRAREKTLARLARDHGLMVSDRPPHLLQASREAAERSQAIWLTALGFVRNRDERAHLYAAWEAWRILERARRSPFEDSWKCRRQIERKRHMKTNTYLALDLEMYWDEHLFEAHRAMDPRSNRRATAVKRVMAASVFEFSVDAEGRVATGEIASWTEHGWGDEQAVIAQLFDYLRARADTPVLTFGGLATDIPVLVLASMAHGLPLPPQLIDQPGRKGPRPHLDLCLMLKGGGRTWSHLSQVLLRLDIPEELVAAKPAVSRPRHDAEWRVLRDHVELDCLLLAIAKVGWLVAQGHDGLRFKTAAIGLISGFLRRRPAHALMPILIDYSVELETGLRELAVST